MARSYTILGVRERPEEGTCYCANQYWEMLKITRIRVFSGEARIQRGVEKGNLTDLETEELLRRHLEEFEKWVLQLVRPRELVRYAYEMDIQPAHA